MGDSYLSLGSSGIYGYGYATTQQQSYINYQLALMQHRYGGGQIPQTSKKDTKPNSWLTELRTEISTWCELDRKTS